jgi:hypothetical protein
LIAVVLGAVVLILGEVVGVLGGRSLLLVALLLEALNLPVTKVVAVVAFDLGLATAVTLATATGMGRM